VAKSDFVLDRLSQLHPKIIDLSLKKLAPVVHVAGTNGKGSFIAFLRAILEARGRRVQSYTSPHLVRFHERIRLTEGLIVEDDLVALLEHCEEANERRNITYFEITTTAALLAFSREPADITLLETGLGGRLDATNVIERPRLCVISPVSIDHSQYLGDSLETIAFEKAGILKAGVPAVIGPQQPKALSVIESRAKELSVPLFVAGRDWSVEREGRHLRYHGRGGSWRFPKPSLPGDYQLWNAGTALAAAEVLEEFDLDPAACAQGLLQASWPGRLQRLTQGPLTEALPEPWELWLDGGHNESAGAALAETLENWPALPMHFIVGMITSKKAEDFLRHILPHAESLQCVTIPDEAASFAAEDLAQIAKNLGVQARAAPSALEAAKHLGANFQGPARAMICGSLYLAGHILSENG
jgi:dihydrofolate synthase/folylpolyglutamate synthase